MDADSRAEMFFNRIARACSILLVVLGALGISGWVLGSRLLTGIRTEYIPMAPNTAVLFFLLGLALLGVTVRPVHRTTRVVVTVFYAACSLVAGLTLAGFLTGTEPGIDSLLINSTGTLGLVPIGRMSPVTATCFLAGSLAVLLLLKKRSGIAAVLGSALLLVSAIILIGYLYGAPLLYGGTIIPVALTTAVAFAVLGTGLVTAAGPASWPLSGISGESTRARLLRMLLPVIILVVLFAHWSDLIIIGNADSTVVLLAAVTVIATVLIVYTVVSYVSRSIGDTIDGSLRERKRAEEALAESERKYRNLYQFAQVGLFETSFKNGTIIACNRRYADLAGFSSIEEAIGKDILHLYVHPEDRTEVGRVLREEGFIENRTLELRNQRTGKIFWGQFSARFDFEREVAEGSIIDITEQKVAEDALRESTLRLREAQEMAHLGFWSWDVRTGNVEWSEEVFKIFGLDPAGFIPHIDSILSFSPWPGDHERDQELIRRAMDTHKAGSYEQRFLRPDKSTGYYYSTFEGRYDDGGTLRYIVGTVLDITRRKQAEEELRGSEERFRTLVEQLPLGIAMTRREGGGESILYYNRAFTTITGYTLESAPSLDAWVLLAYPDPAYRREMSTLLSEMYREADRDITSGPRTTRVTRNDGAVREVEFRYTDLKVFGFWTLNDITERILAETALRGAHERLQSFVDANVVGFVIANPGGEILETNDYYLHLIGYTREEFEAGAVDWRSITPPEWLSADENAIRELRERGTCTPYEKEYVRRDGTRVAVLLTDTMLSGPDEQIVAFVVDITGRKRGIEALKLSEEHHRRLFETMIQGVVYQDREGNIISMNPAAEQILGKTREEFLGKSSVSIEHDTIREDGSPFPGMEHPAMVAIRSGRDVRDVVMGVFNPKKKMYRWIRINAVPVFRPGVDFPHQVYTIFDDITDRRNVEHALRESEAKYRELFENITAAFALHEIVPDPAGKPVDYRFLMVNPAFEKMTGLVGADIIHRTVLDVLPGTELSWIETYGEVALTGRPALFENFSKPLNKYFEVRAYSPKRGQFATVFTDITERRSLEQQRETLIRELEQKNAELERFTFTVSHDLKSPLITIRGFAGLLEDDVRNSDELQLKKDIHRIMDAADTMQALLADLLQLSRVGKIANHPVKTSFGTIAHEAVDLLAGLLVERGVTVEIAPDLPDVTVDHARIREVMVNLIENAVKFLGSRPDPLIRIGVDQRDGQRVFFVQDNGIGINPRYLERIFNLFERLDAATHGTGIGLPITRRIIEVHGGKIWAESEGAGKGTTFWFTLPGSVPVPDPEKESTD